MAESELAHEPEVEECQGALVPAAAAVLVLQTIMLQIGGVTSQVVAATTGLVAMTRPAQVVLVQLVLHVQMTKMLGEMMMMMLSDARDQIQLAAPFILSLSLLDLCGDR